MSVGRCQWGKGDFSQERDRDLAAEGTGTTIYLEL